MIDGPDDAANARLIAAAPDGYELAQSMRHACEERLSVLNGEMSHGREGADDDELDDLQDQIDNWYALLDKCNAYLATAEGRSDEAAFDRGVQLYEKHKRD